MNIIILSNKTKTWLLHVQRFYIVKHIRPAFEGDALEDREHGQSEIVEICDAVIRALPKLFAAVVSSSLIALESSGAAWYRIVHYLVCDIKVNRIFNPNGITAVAERNKVSTLRKTSNWLEQTSKFNVS